MASTRQTCIDGYAVHIALDNVIVVPLSKHGNLFQCHPVQQRTTCVAASLVLTSIDREEQLDTGEPGTMKSADNQDYQRATYPLSDESRAPDPRIACVFLPDRMSSLSKTLLTAPRCAT